MTRGRLKLKVITTTSFKMTALFVLWGNTTELHGKKEHHLICDGD